MKISEQSLKPIKPMFEHPKITVFTLRDKNKILGWRVNKREFLVTPKSTILQTWIKTEKYINSIL